MSELESKIEKDIIQALKEKDEKKVSVLRFLKAAIEEKFIQNKKEDLKEEDVIQVIKKQLKQIEDSMEAFKKGDREDLVKKEEYALPILKDYLPPEKSKEEIETCIKKVIEEVEAQGKKDFGVVMGKVMSNLKAQADGKIVSQIVNEELSKLEQKKS